jgi:hypothetical protein
VECSSKVFAKWKQIRRLPGMSIKEANIKKRVKIEDIA